MHASYRVMSDSGHLFDGQYNYQCRTTCSPDEVGAITNTVSCVGAPVDSHSPQAPREMLSIRS